MEEGQAASGQLTAVIRGTTDDRGGSRTEEGSRAHGNGQTLKGALSL